MKKNIVAFKSKKYPEKFAEIVHKPNLFDLLPYVLYSLPKESNYRRKLFRSFRINRLPVLSVSTKSTSTTPLIELIINSERKDFCNLNEVIEYAVMNSINKIIRITVAVPATQVDECRAILSENSERDVIEVVSEDIFLNDTIREKLQGKFAERYGWVLQQFLTLDMVLKSNTKGVLQVNADTILLRPTQWLDSEDKQPILVSTEYHSPYYLFLNRLNNEFPVYTDTHITHHMLFQPQILGEILKRSKIRNLEELVDFTIINAKIGEASPICVEFELYALGVLTYFPERVKLAKFGNINYVRPQKSSRSMFQEELLELAKKYNSISLHSYLS